MKVTAYSLICSCRTDPGEGLPGASHEFAIVIPCPEDQLNLGLATIICMDRARSLGIKCGDEVEVEDKSPPSMFGLHPGLEI